MPDSLTLAEAVKLVDEWLAPVTLEKIVERHYDLSALHTDLDRLRAFLLSLQTPTVTETLEQAARLLRENAGLRQHWTGKWTPELQAMVGCAIKLEAAALAGGPQEKKDA